MLCEAVDASNLLLTWAALAALGSSAVIAMSGVVFAALYVRPTYAMWRWKINPRYPPVAKVRQESVMSLFGAMVATFCPALTLHLAQRGLTKGYCGFEGEGHDVRSTAIQFMITWGMADLYHWAYHYMGHSVNAAWEFHRSHHQMPNPTPFAVIADEFVDQFMRSLPMLVFPMLMPINLDVMLLLQWGLMYYAYGVFIHSGYDSPLALFGAHQPILNVSYHHHLHHAISTNQKPLHTGFWIKLWDQLAGSTHQGKCFCCRCQQAEGKRTEKEFSNVVVPDYSVLLQPSFWLAPAPKDE